MSAEDRRLLGVPLFLLMWPVYAGKQLSEAAAEVHDRHTWRRWYRAQLAAHRKARR